MLAVVVTVNRGRVASRPEIVVVGLFYLLTTLWLQSWSVATAASTTAAAAAASIVVCFVKAVFLLSSRQHTILRESA